MEAFAEQRHVRVLGDVSSKLWCVRTYDEYEVIRRTASRIRICLLAKYFAFPSHFLRRNDLGVYPLDVHQIAAVTVEEYSRDPSFSSLRKPAPKHEWAELQYLKETYRVHPTTIGGRDVKYNNEIDALDIQYGRVLRV